jgi:small subunit ribosomal protein S16
MEGGWRKIRVREDVALLKIRLSRRGAKGDPHYRVVVAEKSMARDGRFVEILGYYNPAWEPVRLDLNLERIDHWIHSGAQPSATVRSLIDKVRKSLQPSAE